MQCQNAQTSDSPFAGLQAVGFLCAYILLCVPDRFSQIESKCASGILDTSPYGVDSVFKLGSVNFNPDLYDPAG